MKLCGQSLQDSYLVQLDVHPLPAQEPGGLKGEDTRIQECILLGIGGEGQPSLTCRVEKGYASFPSQRNLMRHYQRKFIDNPLTDYLTNHLTNYLTSSLANYLTSSWIRSFKKHFDLLLD